jgi:hypothetical protein
MWNVLAGKANITSTRQVLSGKTEWLAADKQLDGYSPQLCLALTLSIGS